VSGRLDPGVLQELDRRLASVDAALHQRYRQRDGARQPVHTVYVPADRFHANVGPQWSEEALATLRRYAPGPEEFAAAIGVAEAAQVYARVRAKLEREPIEDLRIDFEDGYGNHPDAVEDAAVREAASALAAAIEAGTAPASVGIRIKSLEGATRRRAVSTLDRFLGALLARVPLPETFVVTLPKVSVVEQVSAMVLLCEQLEAAYGLPYGRLRFEIQVETPAVVLGADGTAPLARCVDAAAGRCVGLHYGTYDYSASCGVAAAYQSMEHPVADYAKAVMQVAVAGTGIRLSDGSTNILPVGDREAVYAAWRLHARLVRRSLERAYYQGWDLHPAQLPTRYAATYVFFRAGLSAAAARLSAYLSRASSGIADEPATVRALVGFLVRGLDCGAVDAAEVAALTGMSRADLLEVVP